MAELDIDKINETIDQCAEKVNAVIDTTRAAILANPKRQKSTLYRSTAGQRWRGVLQSVFGYGLTGIGTLVMAAGILSSGAFAAVAGGVFIAAGIPLGASGTANISRANRFRNYLSALGTKTFINLKSLSEATGKSVRFLQKDLQDMMNRKMFLQGHFDDEKTGFIASDETYASYRQSLITMNEKIREEEEEDEALKSMSTEGRRLYRMGEDYIRKISDMNDELPGEEISKKLDALENVMRRIMLEVKKKPEKVSELRRMMNYYLPTTWKLLESYKTIEKESYKTEQMRETQGEIENTLDTVNSAFENLLDQLFETNATDIKSDIKVLNTMLKTDNLKKSDFGPVNLKQ